MCTTEQSNSVRGHSLNINPLFFLFRVVNMSSFIGHSHADVYGLTIAEVYNV